MLLYVEVFGRLEMQPYLRTKDKMFMWPTSKFWAYVEIYIRKKIRSPEGMALELIQGFNYWHCGDSFILLIVKELCLYRFGKIQGILWLVKIIEWTTCIGYGSLVQKEKWFNEDFLGYYLYSCSTRAKCYSWSPL